MLNTNIIIAAITNPNSASAEILNETLDGDGIQTCLSPAMLREYERGLRPFGFILNKRGGRECLLINRV